jgi:ferredoxin
MPVISKIKVKNASITKDNLLDLLRKISKDKTLIAPVKDRDVDDVDFLPVADVAEICFDYENTATSPKEYFFPQYETMFTFSTRSHESIEAKDGAGDIVLFGIRACDVKAVELLDKFYERNFEDSFYLSRRRKSILISVACSQLNEQCFCTSTETGPVLTEEFDIQLLNAGDGYAVQIGSEKGLELYEKHRQLFGPAVGIDAEQLLAEANKQPRKFSLRKVYEALEQDAVDEAMWEDMGERCQSCGLCLFLCPTCSCFSVADGRMASGENRRSRQWDACYFTGITRMAGGNNPVRTRAQMLRRKYYHKLCQQLDEFSMSGCVGCGRCNLVCVGNVNWLNNIIRIEKESKRVQQ